MVTIAKNIDQEVDQYMAMPYRIEMVPDQGGWYVLIPELPGCMSQGDSPEEALEMLRDAQRLWLRVALEDGDPIPEPAPRGRLFSGKFNVRVPRDLHKALVYRAELEGVSLNSLVTAVLASSVGASHGQDKHIPAS